ncbi:hypothetical protein SAMN05421686_10351 [Thalassolituus maritimus]|uniref:Uncharacterized protein n=1 Tax=Thalassolituus maritimus TaxID=484498 RepID=A0A1N7KRC5_9GAMM|nr:hypothetical protein [Thalassolituus maritimus]SIS64107.1 hypothetical protein SAMN05421686_10351 [Thalassolituus maritimus]
MHFLKLALVASGAASIFMLHKVIVNNNIPLAALFLVVPFIIFAVVQLRRTVRCQECGISPFEDGFDDPDRVLPVKFDYTRIGSGPIFRFYKLQLRLGMGTCAACTKNIREQTKPRG